MNLLNSSDGTSGATHAAGYRGHPCRTPRLSYRGGLSAAKRRQGLGISSMMSGLSTRLSWPYVGELSRSLLGVLVVAAIAMEWASPGAALAAGGSAVIAGAVALQDSPYGRVQQVITVSFLMSVAVLVGTLTAPLTLLFVVVVALWCFAAGMMWALGANVGLVAAAASALLVTAPTSTSADGAFDAAALAWRAGSPSASGRGVAETPMADSAGCVNPRLSVGRQRRPPLGGRPRHSVRRKSR